MKKRVECILKHEGKEYGLACEFTGETERDERHAKALLRALDNTLREIGVLPKKIRERAR